MRTIYDSHIIKLDGIEGRDGHQRLCQLVSQATGSQVIVRLRQGDIRAELMDVRGDLLDQISIQGVNLQSPFYAEIITRHPSAFSAPAHPKAYVDGNDFNQLQNGRSIVGANEKGNPHRGCPMFFRENGASLDLMDLYLGQTLFLVLNGQSFKEVDRSLFQRPGIMTFGVNNGAHGMRTDFWTCVDDPTRFMRSIWRDPRITKFVPMAHFRKPIWDVERNMASEERVADFPNVIGYRRNEAFDASRWLNEDTINWGNHGDRGGGRTVMLAALRIAYLLGFRRVHLVGCDFHMAPNHTYWFEEQRTDHAIKNNLNSYRIMTRYFELLQPLFLEAGFEVFNCTPGSHLKIFPEMKLEDAIEEAAVDTSASTYGMYVDRSKNNAAKHQNGQKKEEAHA